MLRFVCLTSSHSPIARAACQRQSQQTQLAFNDPSYLFATNWAHYVYTPLFNYQYLSIDWNGNGFDLEQINDLFFVSPRAVEGFVNNLRHLTPTQRNDWIAQRNYYAVGASTAARLYQFFGEQISVIAPQQSSGVQALAQTIENTCGLRHFQGRRILWLRGTDTSQQLSGNGAEDLLNSLRPHAQQLNTVAVYQRLPVDWFNGLSQCAYLAQQQLATHKEKTIGFYWDLFTRQAPDIIQTRWQNWWHQNESKRNLEEALITHRAIYHHPNLKALIHNKPWFSR